MQGFNLWKLNFYTRQAYTKEMKCHAPKRKICLALGMNMYYLFWNEEERRKEDSETILGQQLRAVFTQTELS